MSCNVQEPAQEILGGISAAELKDVGEAAFDARVAAASFGHFLFKMRANEETYNDETRVKLNVVRWASSCS